jgi:hypothetical protein
MEKEELLNKLKRHTFYELLSATGRVMVLVRYSPDVIIGRRGFVGDEKEAGLTLAFNSKMKFAWDEHGITATLAFGTAPQRCFIPADSIAAVYSPEMRVQLFTAVSEKTKLKNGATLPEAEVALAQGVDAGYSDNIINVDFVRKKRLGKEDAHGEDS